MNRADDCRRYDGGDLPSWVLTTRTMPGAVNEMPRAVRPPRGRTAVSKCGKLIRPKPRLLCTGTGGGIPIFMELETSIRKKLPIVVVIGTTTISGE
jgi:acetolactate synthase-1/2/3 large subunit